MGSHHSANAMKDEWLTPPALIAALGAFDLDPCAPIVRPSPTAARHFTIEDSGLQRQWEGRVWCNPPYGLKAYAWIEKMALHANGVALVFARTETEMFFRHIWSGARAILFIRGRLTFHNVDGSIANGNAGAPSCLVAYGEDNAASLLSSRIRGQYVEL